MRQTLKQVRPTVVALACAAMLAACGGGGGGGGDSGSGRLQVINFNYPGGGTLMTAPTALKATASSGLPVSYTSGTPATCTVSGSQMTLVSAGECRVIATQAGGTAADGVQWAPADASSQLFNVLKHPQTVQIQAPDYVLSTNASQTTLAATSDSGLPVTFSVTTPTVCSVTGNTLKLLGKGSCEVTATQAGDANYSSAKADAFVAVDPLLVADGILGGARGSTNAARTKQNGAVTSNPWSSLLNSGWEWCSPNDRCFSSVSADQRTFTSALRISNAVWKATGWHQDFNNIEIFAPGLSGFNQSGDTTGGLQVTTETIFAMTLGVNTGLYKTKKPVVVQLDLGKRNNGCNPTVSALLWPAAAGVAATGIVLSNFAVTQACGLPGVSVASLDNDVRKLPRPLADSLSASVAAAQEYEEALNKEPIKSARASAMTLLKSSNIVRVRLRLMDVNLDFPGDGGSDVLASDLSVVGAIKIQ